jgi:hypothetical protein
MLKYCLWLFFLYLLSMADTGRGNKNTVQLDKTINYFRKKYPVEITPIELAKYLKCQQARAMRVIDLLSGNTNESENTNFDFLIYCNDEQKPITYGIFKDVKYNIYA